MAVDPQYVQHQQRKRNLRDFNHHTKLLLTESERDYIHSLLKEYHIHREVPLLVQGLKSLLDTPSKLDLLKDIRVFIPRNHLAQFDHLVPYHRMAHPLTLRTAISQPNLSIVVPSNGTDSHSAYSVANPHVHMVQSGSSHGHVVWPSRTRSAHGPVIHPSIHHHHSLVVAGASTSLPRPRKRQPGHVMAGSLTVPRPPKPRPSMFDGARDPAGTSSLLLHTVTLIKDPHEGLGFSIRGGSEHGLGIYISELDPDSPAEHTGLRLGDNIVEVNNITFENISSSSAVKVLTGSRRLKMVIRRVGKIPGFKFAREKTSWYDVAQNRIVEGSFEDHGTFHSPVGLSYVDEAIERRIHISITQEDQYLGFNIRGGSEYGLGVYVSRVDPGGLGEHMGLKMGDQVLEVNGINFENITHANAVDMMRSHTQLIMSVRDIGKYPAYKEIYAEYSWIDGTTGTISKSRSGYITSVPVRSPSPENTAKSFTEYPLDTRVESYAQTEYGHLDTETGRQRKVSGYQSDSDDELPDHLPGEPDMDNYDSSRQNTLGSRRGHSPRQEGNSHMLLPKTTDVMMIERPAVDGMSSEQKKPTKKDSRSPKSSLGVKAMQREQQRYLQAEAEQSHSGNSYRTLPNGHSVESETLLYKDNKQKATKLARSDGDLLQSQQEESWNVDRGERTRSLQLENNREGELPEPPPPRPPNRQGSFDMGKEKKEKKARGKPLQRVQSLRKPGEIDPRKISEEALSENPEGKIKRSRTFRELLFGTKSRGKKLKTGSTGPSTTKTKSRKSLTGLNFSFKRNKHSDNTKSQENNLVNGLPGDRSSGDSSAFSQGSSSQLTPQDSSSSNPALSSIHSKAHKLLNDDEAQAIVRHIGEYERQHNVEALVTPIQAILDTPEKSVLLQDIRNVIEPSDLRTFDRLAAHQDYQPHKEMSGKTFSPNGISFDPDGGSQTSEDNGSHRMRLQLPSRNGHGRDPLTYSRLGLGNDDSQIVVPASPNAAHSMEIHRARSSSKIYRAVTGGEAWELSSLHTSPEHGSQYNTSSPHRSKSAEDILTVEVPNQNSSGNRNSNEFSYRSGRSSPISDISSAYSGISGRYSVNQEGRDYHDKEPVYASLDDMGDGGGEIKFLRSRQLDHRDTKDPLRGNSLGPGSPSRSVGNALVFLDVPVSRAGYLDDEKSLGSDVAASTSAAFEFLDSVEDYSEGSKVYKHKPSSAQLDSDRGLKNKGSVHNRNPPSRSNSRNKHGDQPKFVAPPPPSSPPPEPHYENAWQEWYTEDITPEMLRHSSRQTNESPQNSTPYVSAKEDLSPDSSPPRERLPLRSDSALKSHSSGLTDDSPRGSTNASLRGRSSSPASKHSSHDHRSLRDRSPSPGSRSNKSSIQGRSPVPSPRSKMSLRNRSPSPASTAGRNSLNEETVTLRSPKQEPTSSNSGIPSTHSAFQRTSPREGSPPSRQSPSPFANATKLSFSEKSSSSHSREGRSSLRRRSPSPNASNTIKSGTSSNRTSYTSQRTRSPSPMSDRISLGQNDTSRGPSPQHSFKESPSNNQSLSRSYNQSPRDNPSTSYQLSHRIKSPSVRRKPLNKDPSTSLNKDSGSSPVSHSLDRVSLHDVSIASFMADSVDKDSLTNVMAPLSRTSTPQGDMEPITVILKKDRPSLGISISGGSNSRKQPHVHIQNVFAPGAAADEGTIRPGMRLLYVGGKALDGATHAQAVEIIRKAYADKNTFELELVLLPQ